MRVLRSATVALVAALSAPQAVQAVDLGDLQVPSSRIPDWHAPAVADTSGWNVVDVSNSTAMNALPGGSCPAATPNDGGSDGPALQCALDRSAPRTVLQLRAGTYALAADQGLVFPNERVLRGQGQGATTISLSGRQPYRANTCVSGRSRVFFHGSRGGSTGWTSGYTRGSRWIGVASTSSFSAGDYVQLHMDNDPAVLENMIRSTDQVFEPIFRIESVNAANQTLLLDRPLRIDYTARGGRTVRKLSPARRAGLESLTLRPQGAVSSDDNKIVCFKYAVESWVQDVEIDGFWEKAIDVDNSARNVIAHNHIHRTSDSNSSNNYAIQLTLNATDNLVHDNVFEKTDNGAVTLQLGSHGNIVSYNYFFDCVGWTRAVFFHGVYPGENLIEGNVSGNCYMDMDNYWGRQGPRNTFYRNRMTHNEFDPSKAQRVFTIRTHNDDGSRIVAQQTNLLLNQAGAFHGGPRKYNLGSNFGFDDGYQNGDSPGLWAEGNVARDTRSVSQCVDVDVPWDCCWGAGQGSCDFGFLMTHAQTNCGLGAGNCPGRNAEGTAAPSAWSGLTFPPSLVVDWNDPAARPPGWCAESPWPAVGADVDVWPNGLTPIPAQRRAQGLGCTGAGGSGGGNGSPTSLAPPFLRP